MEKTIISWQYPPTRKGLAGVLDRISGTGATDPELYLTLAATLLGGVGVVVYGFVSGQNWNVFQYLIIAFLAADLLGGIVSNATSASKRWWHRAGQGFWQHFSFVAFHLYPLLITWLFRNMDWLYFGTIYGYLLLSAFLILKTPLYLQRPLAMLLYCGALLIDFYAFPVVSGLEWFVPFLFLKLLVAHLLKEEPYRPFSEGRN